MGLRRSDGRCLLVDARLQSRSMRAVNYPGSSGLDHGHSVSLKTGVISIRSHLTGLYGFSLLLRNESYYISSSNNQINLLERKSWASHDATLSTFL